MTREEAITYLKVIWNRYKAEYEIERETLDAYHMAIEALMHANSRSTHERDLISRKDAMRRISEQYHEWGDGYDALQILGDLEDMPSAETHEIRTETHGVCLVSKDDAIEAVRKELVCDGRHETHDKTCRFIADVLLSALPSADAVQGEWIDRSNGGRIIYPWWENCECNQCGEYGSGAYNYCPNCGARMKGGAE